MSMLWWWLACDPYQENSDVCGRIERQLGAPPADSVTLMTVAAGRDACDAPETGDTDGPWWDEIVADPVPEGGRFEAEVEPGTYAVEVVAGGGGYGGCVGFDVPSTEHCAAEPVVVVREIIQVDKPNLYLYPPAPQDVSVRLPAWQRIVASDPDYPVGGWRVLAGPDGRIDTPAGPRDFLFYEMSWDEQRFQTTSGWCADGALAQRTIEDAMADLGFLPNEIADFADAWDPDFPDADAVTVYPQLADLADLRIDPPPDTTLRAWFYVVPGCRDARPPELRRGERWGFHAAEWGVAFGGDLR